MASNSFGTIFRFTTWGESHGVAIGCVVDGCPSRMALSEADIQPFLEKRKPGQSRFTTQRREGDGVKILSGVFEGQTTGNIHALYRIYGQDLLDEKENKVDIDDPSSGKRQLLKFQVQNANSLIKKLEGQGVAMLSDSVGLGKTCTAIKVIEYYKHNLNQRVVVIAPAGLIQQSSKAFDEFRIIHIPEIYSLQDKEKIKDVRENLQSIPVGLFVFDESHNLRAAGGQRFDVFIKWRQENENAKTLLLTATPINNQLADLTNQIMLGSGGDIFKLGKFYDRSRQKYFTLSKNDWNFCRQICEDKSVKLVL